MTRQEITTWIINRLGETDGGAAGSLNPFGYDDDINEAANEIALATDCLYVAETMDVTAGQSDYCAPPLYKTVGASVYDSSSTLVSLTEYSPWQTFRADGQGHAALTPGTPSGYIDLGGNLIRLVPAPSYNSVLASITDLAILTNPFQVTAGTALSSGSPSGSGTTTMTVVGNFLNPAAAPGDPGFSETTTVSSGSSGSSGILISIPVSYAPNPATCALIVTQGGVRYPATGAYAATITANTDGTYNLSATIPSGPTADYVLVYPGDLLGGIFTPSGPPIGGLLQNPYSAAPINPILSSANAGQFIQVTGGAGFTAGRYQIASVSASGVATLSRSPGSAGSTGGAATLSSGGLSVEGYAIPGNSWPNPADTCPLPPAGHIAVAARAAWLRCLTYPSAANSVRMPGLDQVYKYAKGQLEGAIARQTDAAAARDGQPLYLSSVASSTDIGNPLEL